MGLNPGYKQTELGVIPEDWDAGKLTRFWTVIDCKHVTAEFVPQGYPIASIREVQSSFVDLTDANHTTEHFYKLLIEGGRKPCPGDLILSRNATVGEIAQVVDSHPQFAMGQDVCLLRKKAPNLSTEFLQAIFQSSVIANQLSNLMVGSTFKRANIEQIRNFSVPMPPPPEQRAIAEALSDVDALIGALDRLIAKKRDLKQDAMQQLLTGQKRLPGFSGEWQVRSLSTICSMKSGEGITSANIDQFSKYPCYGGNGLRGYTTRFTHDGRYALVGRQGALCGNVYGVEGQFFASEHAIVVTASADTDIQWLTSVLGRMNLNQYSESSAQPGLSVSKILKLEIAVPPTKAEQSAIAEVLTNMDSEIAALEQRRDKTRALKQGMMQELLTGRTRLV
jgi:type I restriction enzyme S subunit